MLSNPTRPEKVNPESMEQRKILFARELELYPTNHLNILQDEICGYQSAEVLRLAYLFGVSIPDATMLTRFEIVSRQNFPELAEERDRNFINRFTAACTELLLLPNSRLNRRNLLRIQAARGIPPCAKLDETYRQIRVQRGLQLPNPQERAAVDNIKEYAQAILPDVWLRGVERPEYLSMLGEILCPEQVVRAANHADLVEAGWLAGTAGSV